MDKLNRLIDNLSTEGIIRATARVFNLVGAAGVNINEVIDSQSESDRLSRAQKLQDFYTGDIDAIKEHLALTLGKTFRPEDIAEFQLLYLPVTRRIIDKLCMVYKGETERYIDGEGNSDKLKALYQKAGVDAKSKWWYRMGKLHHTVLVQPVVREIDGEKRLQFDIWTPNVVTVVEDPADYLVPAKVIYQVAVRTPEGKIETQTVFWSKTEHFRTDEKGNKIADPNNPNGENPYGVLPFAVLRFGETEDFWGEGETLLVNVEEKVDVLLVQLLDLLIMQGHGQAVLTNANIEGEIQTGPKHALELHPKNPDQAASFEFVTVNGKVSEITSAIDWLINKTAVLYGLSQSSEVGQSQVASGYAKMLDNWDVIEKREEDIAILQVFERDLFRIVRIVCDYEGIEKFPDKAEDTLFVEFDGYEFPEDPKVEIEVKKAKMDLGLWTPVDDLMSDDPTLSKEEAMAILEENLTIRNRLRDEFGLTNPLNNQQNPNGLPGQ